CVFILCLSAVCRLVRQLACSCLFPYTTLFRSYFHHLPPWAHKAEVVANHITQLIVPFALFAPQPVASVAAGVVIVTQGWLVLSGNFSWLNFLAITLAVSAIDGTLVGASPPDELATPPTWYGAVILAVTALVVVLSYWPVRNLLRRKQVMN